MSHLFNAMWKMRLWKETRGQDLIEYALLAAFVAVAAGATFPPVANNISAIYSKINSSMAIAISQS